ncbi:hypothetical protein B2J93_648 [Marssonina coronariae]|uniref:NodB homology domain-containing protein n=1 Tax=Diplocarpon coronariae TaxID=2795749 RepID=A0A218ZAP7_9HELO|nr:hypothetical protein B2J93_648 [Marssonina coronariae]
MKLISILVWSLAALAGAHSHPREIHAGLPQLVGARQLLSELKANSAIPAIRPLPAIRIEERGPEPALDYQLEARQNTDGQCGPDFGSSPDCQYKYGPGCDANQIPAGASTASIARPALGSVPYGGAGIYDCVVAGDVAFTFDDGPYSYTSDLLDKLKVHNAKATFFITGNNLGKGPIDSTAQWSSVIKRMVAEGHQVASHTWSHQDLSTLDAATFNKQMVYNEMAFRNILGYFPTYMRPPYSSCNSACESRLKTLGYHVTYFDLDTAGYLNDLPTTIQNSKNIWDSVINPSNSNTDSFLEIEHDIHQQVVYNLTDYILASMYSRGYRSVTVGDCLQDPAANWMQAGLGDVFLERDFELSQNFFNSPINDSQVYHNFFKVGLFFVFQNKRQCV